MLDVPIRATQQYPAGLGTTVPQLANTRGDPGQDQFLGHRGCGFRRLAAAGASARS